MNISLITYLNAIVTRINFYFILPQVEDLARVSFKRAPLYIGVDDGRSKATVEGLEQGYCVVSSAERFLLLFTFLKKNLKKKVSSMRHAVFSCLSTPSRVVPIFM